MGNPRLHWFWRGGIAVAIGTFVGASLLVLFGIALFDFNSSWADLVLVYSPFLSAAAAAATAVASYAHLTHRSRSVLLDPETRCRKFGYILRGITEPRCPECGERI